MCKRSNPDPLARIFLERYRMNLLAMPGNRVRCGSVYVKQGRSFTAPGDLADLVEPDLQLPPPYRESDLPELRGVWSDKVEAQLGIGLLQNFLLALGAAGLVDHVKAHVKRRNVCSVTFRFRDPERESFNPTALGHALEDHRFRGSSPWVSPGNSYYVAAAVIRSPSISIRARDERDNAVDLGAGVATAVEATAGVSLEHGEDNELTYKGKEPIGFAVELYWLGWDDERGSLVFNLPKGPQPVAGFDDGDRPEPVFVGEDDEAVVEVMA
jgi:hypothetical protein